jgi:hypothetical protein
VNQLRGPAAMNLRYWPVKNFSGEEIPAFACMQLNGLTMMDDSTYGYYAVKPSRFGAQHQHVFNGSTPIPAGKTGVAVSGDIVAALYEVSDGLPNVPESLGPRSGGWKLRRNTGGFALGAVTTSVGETTPDEIVRVTAQPMLQLIAKADGGMIKTTTANVSIYWREDGDPIATLTDTGVDVLAISRYADVASGKYVQLTWMPWESWEVTAIEPVDAALFTT